MSDLDPTVERQEGAAAPEVPLSPSVAEPPQKRKSRLAPFFFGLFSGCLLVILAVFAIAAITVASSSEPGEYHLSASKIAVVPIEGEILDSRDTIEALHRYAQSTLVRAIIVRIDSPGGAIAPSQEIYEAIRKIRAESGKPIVASLDSVAASGGYYIAVACDRIVANPGSITGSIGVIMQWVEMKDLLAWAKLNPETITSGAMKAAGSPYERLTDAEREYLQGIVTQLHGQFVRAVAESRKGKVTAEEVARLADGRVFTGEQALGLKLVDELGNFDDAVTAAAKLAGVKGRPTVVYPRKHKNGLLDLLSGTNDAETAIDRILSRRSPRFLFRW